MSADHQPQRGTPGPKKDSRPNVDFKVEPDVYETLVGLQAETSLTPDLAAALILHKVIRDPEGAADLPYSLLSREKKPVTIEPPTILADRRQDRRGS